MNCKLFLNFTEIQNMDDAFKKQIIEDLKNNIPELGKTFSKLIIRIAKKPTVEIPIYSPSTETAIGTILATMFVGLNAFAERKGKVAAAEKQKPKKESKKKEDEKKESWKNARTKTVELFTDIWQTGRSGLKYYSKK